MSEQTASNWLRKAKEASDEFETRRTAQKQVETSREASNRLVILLDLLTKKLGNDVGQDIILHGSKTPTGYLELDGYVFHAYRDDTYGYEHLRVGKIVEGGYFFMEGGDVVNLPSLQGEIDRLEESWKERQDAEAKKAEAKDSPELTDDQQGDIAQLSFLIEVVRDATLGGADDAFALALLRWLRYRS